MITSTAASQTEAYQRLHAEISEPRERARRLGPPSGSGPGAAQSWSTTWGTIR